MDALTRCDGGNENNQSFNGQLNSAQVWRDAQCENGFSNYNSPSESSSGFLPNVDFGGHNPFNPCPNSDSQSSQTQGVGQELAQLNQQINLDYGDLGGKYWGLEKQVNGIEQQEQFDQNNNGGSLTSQEQSLFAQDINQLQTEVTSDDGTPGHNSNFGQEHPLRSQVLNQDAHINQQINQDYGHLNGQYWNLENQDLQIMESEQQDARENGGTLTQTEYQQLQTYEQELQAHVQSADSNTGIISPPPAHYWPPCDNGFSGSQPGTTVNYPWRPNINPAQSA